MTVTVTVTVHCGSLALSAGNIWLRNATMTVIMTVIVTFHCRITRAIHKQLMVTECDRDRGRDRDRVLTLTDHSRCPQTSHGFGMQP